MITPYAYTQLIPRPRPRCDQCRSFLGIAGITDIVSEFDGEMVVYDVHVPDRLYEQSIYNIPINIDEYQGPERSIQELPAASRRAIALNGYNHTDQGIVDFCAWVDGTRISRPERLLLFQPLFVETGKRLHLGSTFTSDHPPVWDFDYKRRLYLSAFDTLDVTANCTRNACNNRKTTHPYGPTQPENLDVLLVHQLSPEIHLETDTLKTSNRYRPEQTKVWTPQKLQHSVQADYTVFIGGISSSACPIGTGSNVDYIRLLLVQTEVYQDGES